MKKKALLLKELKKKTLIVWYIFLLLFPNKTPYYLEKHYSAKSNLFGLTKMLKKNYLFCKWYKSFPKLYVTSKKHISKNQACIVFNKIFQRLSLTHVCLFYINKMTK